MKGIKPTDFLQLEHRMITVKGVSIARRTNSHSRGNPLLIKGFKYVEDEEGETILLDTGNLKTTPSILFYSNQRYGKRENYKDSDWFGSCL